MKHLEIAGVKLLAEDDRIVASVRSGTPFETDSLIRWREICVTGGLALDIGAYTGLYSIAAAKAGCRVMAFEPLAANAKRCRRNFRENGVEVELIEAVVSERCGEAKITVNPNVQGLTSGASLVRKTGVKRGVRAVTVDSLGLRQCTAMKIDVERAEPLVLAGAQETLRQCRPMLLVEVLDNDRNYGVKRVLNGAYCEVERLDGRNVIFAPC